jgi:hypothetical protein
MGTDFSSTCAPSGGPSSPATFVFLGATTLYPKADYSGAACVVPAGTKLTNAAFSAATDPRSGGTVSGSELQQKCGVSGPMYGKEIAFADLFPKG